MDKGGLQCQPFQALVGLERESSIGTPSVFGMSPAASTPAHSEAASVETATGLDTAATAATSVDGPSASAHPAPWGTICLGLLLQRCSDKSAAVRAKALHHLAEAVHAMLAGAAVANSQPALQCRRVSSSSGAGIVHGKVLCMCSARMCKESRKGA